VRIGAPLFLIKNTTNSNLLDRILYGFASYLITIRNTSVSLDPNSRTRQGHHWAMSLVLTGLMNYAAGRHYCDPYFWSGVVRGLSLVSTTKTANKLAGSLSLAFSLIL
jgi:hypothetical protein